MINVNASSPHIGFGMSTSARPRPAFQRALPMTTGAVSPAVACATWTDVRGTAVRGAVHVVADGNGTLPGTSTWSPPD